MKNLKSPCILVLGLAMSIASSCQLRAQTYTPVHSFSPWSKDGCCQGSPGLLAEGIDGNIYGTNPSQLGGYGTLISYSPSSGVFFTPANFQGGLNGDTPQSGLTLGADGYLYGTTLRGGTNKVGTVVRSAGGIPTGIYSFLNGKDGAYPWAPPVQTPDGNLWGVTYNGALQGTVYRLTPAGVLTYTNVLPSQTKAPLILAADGNLYGTTTGGGTYNAGTVFQLTPGGTITIVHSFNSSTEGYSPSGPVMQGSDGRLYGTTHWGGTNGLGTVYRVSTNGSGFFTLHQFQNSAMTKEGDYPNSGLVQGSDGYLYGVAPSGGSTGYGTLFKLDTVGNNFTVLHNFDSTGGSTPDATPLLHTNGKIYGMTTGGGSGYGVLYSFDAGLMPFANLIGPRTGPVGTIIGVQGQGFYTATAVLIGLTSLGKLNVHILSDTYMTLTVPSLPGGGGHITVYEPSGNLVTPQVFSLPCPLRFCFP